MRAQVIQLPCRLYFEPESSALTCWRPWTPARAIAFSTGSMGRRWASISNLVSRKRLRPQTADLSLFGHEVEIDSLDIETHSTVFFCADATIRKNVLGRHGWLDRLKSALSITTRCSTSPSMTKRSNVCTKCRIRRRSVISDSRLWGRDTPHFGGASSVPNFRPLRIPTLWYREFLRIIPSPNH
jgi:hypothetical protein